MKRALPPAALIAFASALILSSCDAMFNANLFKAAGLGQFDLAKADLSSASGVHEAAASSPEAFYSQLADDPSAQAEAIASLQAGGSVADQVLQAAIIIKTTDAGTVVDNLAGQLPTLVSSSSNPDMATVLKAVIPSDIDLSSPTPPPAFAAMIAAFTSASGIFDGLATAGTLAPIPGGTEQDAAYYGLASLAVAAVSPNPGYVGAPYPTAGGGAPTPADALWAVMTGQADSSAISFDTANFDMTDPYSPAYQLLTIAGIDPASFQ